MGKTNKIDLNDPEALKAQGNKAFANHQFDEAIQWYT
jgi:Flp pilus assembly protein TadD